MTRSRLLLAVAAVLAGATALFVVLGAVFNLLLVAAAVPFGAAAYFLWSHATGRLQARVHRRFVEREVRERDQRAAWTAREATTGPDGPASWTTADGATRSMGRAEAFAALGLSPGADQRAIRQAYRDRVKAVHPDADGGDEDEFRRVRAAYERLRDPRRGKG